jgi:hypothetical protein
MRVDVLPELGKLRLSALKKGRLDRFLCDLYRRKGYAVTKGVPSVLSGTCGLLTGRDVLPANPIRDVCSAGKGSAKGAAFAHGR